MVNFREEFKIGEESAKIRSRKQAVITALLQGTVIAIAIFNEFSILGKIFIFIVLQLILGGLMSSDWMQKKLKPSKDKNKISTQDLIDSLQRGITEETKTRQNEAAEQPDDIEEEILIQALQKRRKEHSREDHK